MRAAAVPQTTFAGPAAVPLLELTPGTTAVVREVLDDHSHAVLRSLGLTDGSSLRVCRLGDPCIIQVRSTRIGLSRTVAESIYVTVPARDAR
jgi:Fe2+ transport system protein FeoA